MDFTATAEDMDFGEQPSDLDFVESLSGKVEFDPSIGKNAVDIALGTMEPTDPESLLGPAHTKAIPPPSNPAVFTPSKDGKMSGKPKESSPKAKSAPKPAPKRSRARAPAKAAAGAKKTYSKDIQGHVKAWNNLSRDRQSSFLKKSIQTEITPKNIFALASALSTLGVQFEEVSFSKADMDPIRGLALSYVAVREVGPFAHEDTGEQDDPW